MSGLALIWAANVKVLKPAAKIVLIQLANFYNKEAGQCNPSAQRLADECEMGPVTLFRHMTTLEEWGLVTQEDSMLKASRYVGVAQPALTQQLKALEGSIEAKLLHRTSRDTRVTKAAAAMVERAKAILEHTALAKRDVHKQRDTVTGEISLMVASAVAEMILPRFLKMMSQEYPDVALRVSSRDSGEVRSALENARDGLGVLPEHDQLKSVNTRHLLTEPMVFVSATDSSSTATSSPITFRKAVADPLIAIEENQPLRLELERLAEKSAGFLECGGRVEF